MTAQQQWVFSPHALHPSNRALQMPASRAQAGASAAQDVFRRKVLENAARKKLPGELSRPQDRRYPTHRDRRERQSTSSPSSTIAHAAAPALCRREATQSADNWPPERHSPPPESISLKLLGLGSVVLQRR